MGSSKFAVVSVAGVAAPLSDRIWSPAVASATRHNATQPNATWRLWRRHETACTDLDDPPANGRTRSYPSAISQVARLARTSPLRVILPVLRPTFLPKPPTSRSRHRGSGRYQAAATHRPFSPSTIASDGVVLRTGNRSRSVTYEPCPPGCLARGVSNGCFPPTPSTHCWQQCDTPSRRRMQTRTMMENGDVAYRAHFEAEQIEKKNEEGGARFPDLGAI
jgi:hypothetical protein